MPTGAGERAREGDNGEFPDYQSGSRDGRSGLRPAESLLNNRSRRHVLRLMSFPKGDQARPSPSQAAIQPWDNVWPPSASTPTGERDIFLPEDGPTELGSNISIADAEWADQGARRADSGQPGLVLWTDGSRDESGAVGYAVARKRGRTGPRGRPT